MSKEEMPTLLLAKDTPFLLGTSFGTVGSRYNMVDGLILYKLEKTMAKSLVQVDKLP